MSRLPITQITDFKETAKERRKKFLPSPPLFQSFVVKSAEAIFFSMGDYSYKNKRKRERVDSKL